MDRHSIRIMTSWIGCRSGSLMDRTFFNVCTDEKNCRSSTAARLSVLVEILSSKSGSLELLALRSYVKWVYVTQWCIKTVNFRKIAAYDCIIYYVTGMQLARVGDRSLFGIEFKCHTKVNDWFAAAKVDQVCYKVDWWRRDRNNTGQCCFPEVDGLDMRLMSLELWWINMFSKDKTWNFYFCWSGSLAD